MDIINQYIQTKYLLALMDCAGMTNISSQTS